MAFTKITAAGIDTSGTITTQSISVSGVSTVGSLSIGATSVISSAFQLQNIASLDATTTATIESAVANAPNTFTDLNITGISTLGITSATNLTSQSLVVSSGSTFTNGPILVGSATSTGTANQRLQVTGGAYVSGSVGIGTTNPTSKLQVVGDTRVSGVVTAFDFYNDAEYPNIRPTLDLAFAETKILDSRITFTRASTATYVNASGLIASAAVNEARFDHNPTTGESLGLLVEEARTNLAYALLSTYDRDGWAGVFPNSGLAPDNTFTATRYTWTSATGGYIRSSFNYLSSNGYYTSSIFIKPLDSVSSSFIQVGSIDSAKVARAFFDHNTKTITSTISTNAIIQNVSSTLTSLPNGWYRLTVSAYVSDYTQLGYSNALTLIYAANNGELDSGDVLISSPQLEVGSFPTSYIPTPATHTGRASTATFYDAAGVIQTAASGVARSNAFFPDSSGVMRSAGLLLEAAGTNLVTYSEQFDNAAWIKTNATITANAAAAPDGTTTAEKLASSTGTWPTFIHQTFGGSGTRTLSVFAKASNSSWLAMGGIGAGGELAYFNLSTGVIATIQGNVTNASMSKLPNGWYRCSVICDFQSYGGFIPVSGDNTLNIAPIGQGVFLWGAQLEQNPYATSYIPTVASTVTRAADTSTSATVTRAADLASMTGTNFSSWYRQDQGTIYQSVKLLAASPQDNQYYGATFSAVTDATTRVTHDYSSLGGGASARTIILSDAGATSATLVILPFNATTRKTASAMQVGSVAFAANGQIVTGTATAMPSTVDRMFLSKSGFTPNTTISRFAYYPVRLPDAQLQTITL